VHVTVWQSVFFPGHCVAEVQPPLLLDEEEEDVPALELEVEVEVAEDALLELVPTDALLTDDDVPVDATVLSTPLLDTLPAPPAPPSPVLDDDMMLDDETAPEGAPPAPPCPPPLDAETDETDAAGDDDDGLETA